MTGDVLVVIPVPCTARVFMRALAQVPRDTPVDVTRRRVDGGYELVVARRADVT